MPWQDFAPTAYLPVVASAAALVLSLVALRYRRRTDRSPAAELAQLTERLQRLEQALDGTRASLETLARHVSALEQKQLDHLQRFALVRFRAFPDVGSDLSFSLALLDAHGNGVILTSLFGRAETRVYAKPVENGRSSYRLAPEEEQALAKALSGRSAAGAGRHAP